MEVADVERTMSKMLNSYKKTMEKDREEGEKDNIKSTGTGDTGTPCRRKRRRKTAFRCHACKKELPFCWNCPCGFQICDECMKENAWGLTNGPTWVCPDCGRVRMF